MRAKWLGAAVAAMMASWAGGVQRAEAAEIIGISVQGTGTGTGSFSSDDPALQPQLTKGKGFGGANAGFFNPGDPRSITASGFVNIENFALSGFGDLFNGSADFTATVDRSTAYITGYFFNNNLTSNYNDFILGTFSFTAKVFGSELGSGSVYNIVSGQGAETIDEQYNTLRFDDDGQFIGVYLNEFKVTIDFDQISGSLLSSDPLVVPLPAAAPLFGFSLLALGGIGYTKGRGKARMA